MSGGNGPTCPVMENKCRRRQIAAPTKAKDTLSRAARPATALVKDECNFVLCNRCALGKVRLWFRSKIAPCEARGGVVCRSVRQLRAKLHDRGAPRSAR